MSLGKKYKKEARKMAQDGGKLSEIAEKFNLAASEFVKEAKKASKKLRIF
ncbi:MAG: hypothetical protein PVF15_11155 [Candidatus Bathyarchaeota archaeon]|jgi:hypothetical protein